MPPSARPDPAAWGLLIADLTRHLAVAYQRSAGHDPEMTTARVLDGLRSEMEHQGE